MFDIGFLELLVIMVIALLVIGPERMPEVARKIGQFMGKLRRFVNTMKEDNQVQETIRDIHDSMNLEEEKKNLNNLGAELEKDMNGFNDINMDEFQRPFGGDVNQGGNQFNKAPAQPVAPKADSTNTTQTNEDTSASTATETASATPAPEAPAKPAEKTSEANQTKS